MVPIQFSEINLKYRTVLKLRIIHSLSAANLAFGELQFCMMSHVNRQTALRAGCNHCFENPSCFLVLREILGEEDWELDKRLLRLSNWLNVPVYMYVYRSADESASMNSSQRCLWTKYEPDNSLPHSEVACRFYVTLFLNQMKNSFDRIVSLRGCNCEIPPPQSLLRNCNCKQAVLFYLTKDFTKMHVLFQVYHVYFKQTVF